MLIAFGMTMIPSGRAAILAYTMPALAIPLSVWILGERLTLRKLAGLALGMAGLALVLGEAAMGLGSAPLGSLLVLGAAASWALGVVLQKRYPMAMPAGPYSAWIMLLGGVPIFVCALLFDDLGALANAVADEPLQAPLRPVDVPVALRVDRRRPVEQRARGALDHVAGHFGLRAHLSGDREAARQPLRVGCRRQQAQHRTRHEPATSLHRPPLRHLASAAPVAC